jgi:hypothetical protein
MDRHFSVGQETVDTVDPSGHLEATLQFAAVTLQGGEADTG